MKIGILTYHRAENYGALLQAYATKTYLLSKGQDVSFIDYWPKYHADYFRLFSWNQFWGKGVKGKLLMMKNYMMPSKHLRKHRLQRFIHEKLGVDKMPVYSDRNLVTNHYDVVVYGSDQIWRKQNLGGVGFDDWYFGSDNVQADKKIVYAGSMGTIDCTEADDEYVKLMMSNFNCISVRESDLNAYLNRIGIDSVQVLDPVFLLSKEQWLKIAAPSIHKGNYILFYNLLNSSNAKRLAKRLGEEKRMPVVEITKRNLMGKGYVRSASVERFLQLINDAAYVVSNSFHGVAFSIIFEKQFYAVGMGKKSSRVVSLLNSIELKERYSNDGLGITDSEINYREVGKRLSKLKNQSASFLLDSLNNA